MSVPQAPPVPHCFLKSFEHCTGRTSGTPRLRVSRGVSVVLRRSRLFANADEFANRVSKEGAVAEAEAAAGP